MTGISSSTSGRFNLAPGSGTACQPGPAGELTTSRLLLSPVRESDLEDFHQLHNDPRGYLHAPLARHPDREHSAVVLADLAADWERDGLGYYSVRDLATSHYLGVGGVRRFSAGGSPGSHPADDAWNVYYRFRPEVWRNGYAVESVRAAAARCVASQPDAVLLALIRKVNVASQHVAERLGMTLSHTQFDVAGEPQLVYQAAASDVG